MIRDAKRLPSRTEAGELYRDQLRAENGVLLQSSGILDNYGRCYVRMSTASNSRSSFGEYRLHFEELFCAKMDLSLGVWRTGATSR